MKILLIRPNCTNNKKDPYITFPLGLGYIASVLENDGHDVKIMDLTLYDCKDNHTIANIYYFKPDIIGYTALSNSYSQISYLSEMIDSHFEVLQVLGGHLAHYSYETVLKYTKINVCVIGEGELTIVDLVSNLSNLNNVKGIAYKNEGQIYINEPRKPINDLDTIPFPAYHLFPMKEYTKLNDVYLSKNHPIKKKEHRVMSIEAGRGCPFRCNFCSKMFKKVRKRSIESIRKEILHLYSRYEIDTFWFQDELLFSNKKYINDFCDNIKDLSIGWYGNARVDSVDKEILQKIKNNKCILVAYGVETGSEKILKNMNKKTTPNKIKNTLKTTIDIGLGLDMGLIVGYPGENYNTIQETIDLLNDVGYPGLRFRYITPFPGSKLYNDCIDNNIIKNEVNYLTSLNDGNGVSKPRFNFTELSDDELNKVSKETGKKVLKNYIIYLLKHPKKLLKYIFKKDIMNPLYIYYNRYFYPTDYDK